MAWASNGLGWGLGLLCALTSFSLQSTAKPVVFALNANSTIRQSSLTFPGCAMAGTRGWLRWGEQEAHEEGTWAGDLLLLQNPNRAQHWHVFESVPQAFALHSAFLIWLDGIYPLLGRDGWDSRQFDLCQLFNLWQLLSTAVHFNYWWWAQMSQRWAQCHINTRNTDNISSSASFLGEKYGATNCPFFPTFLLPAHLQHSTWGKGRRGRWIGIFLPLCWCTACHLCFLTKTVVWLIHTVDM